MGNDEESIRRTGIKRSGGLLTYSHPSNPPISNSSPLFHLYFRFSVAVQIMDQYLMQKLFMGEFVVVDTPF